MVDEVKLQISMSAVSPTVDKEAALRKLEDKLLRAQAVLARKQSEVGYMAIVCVRESCCAAGEAAAMHWLRLPWVWSSRSWPSCKRYNNVKRTSFDERPR